MAGGRNHSYHLWDICFFGDAVLLVLLINLVFQVVSVSVDANIQWASTVTITA
jgi:hypothetical protein